MPRMRRGLRAGVCEAYGLRGVEKAGSGGWLRESCVCSAAGKAQRSSRRRSVDAPNPDTYSIG